MKVTMLYPVHREFHHCGYIQRNEEVPSSTCFYLEAGSHQLYFQSDENLTSKIIMFPITIDIYNLTIWGPADPLVRREFGHAVLALEEDDDVLAGRRWLEDTVKLRGFRQTYNAAFVEDV